MNQARSIIAIVAVIIALLVVIAPGSLAQRALPVAGGTLRPSEATAQLQRALKEGREAERRAARLTREAEQASEAADRAARQSAALAARIQASEAEITAQGARYALARQARNRLRARLAERQQPLVQLTGALQNASRRPLALSALQPGSLEDIVHVRAVLAATVPQIRERTADLRAELARGERLEQRMRAALVAMRALEEQLRTRREALAAVQARGRMAARAARGSAAQEAQRALVLAEEARDLDGLIERIDEAARLRRELAALPGPILRPSDIGADIAEASRAAAPTRSDSPPGRFQMPVQGRTLAGFGEQRASGARATGLALAPAPRAIVVAPAAGRIVFAGPYRGFDRVVIIEHDRGWTSLVTGLAQSRVNVGDVVIAGAPIGMAAPEGGTRAGDPAPVTFELRREGEPVNPLRFIR